MPTNYSQPQSNQGYTRYPTPIPATPGYWEGANVQGQANTQAALDTTRISNPNISGPYGSQNITYGPDGTPTINQSIPGAITKDLRDYRFSKVDPLNMGALPGVDGLSNDGMTSVQGLTNQGLFNLSPIDTSGLTQRQTMPTVGGQGMVADALREREQPRFDRARSQSEADLLARGFNPGTQGYDARMDEVNRRENDFNLGLTSLSGQEQSRLFDMESGMRGQELNEMLAEFGTTSQARGQMFGERESMFGSQLAQRGQEFGERQAMFDSQEQSRSRALAEQLARYGTQADTRGREVGEQITARQIPMQEYATMMGIPGFQGAQVNPGDYQGALNAEGLFNLGRYGTSIQGELGTRGIDANKKASNRGLFTDILNTMF